MTAEELLAEAKENAIVIQAEFTEPGDDWEPLMLMINSKEERGLVGIDPTFMSQPFLKDVLAESILPEAIQRYDAKQVAFMSSAWTLEGIPSDTKPEDMPVVREHPNRKEALFVEVITATEYLFSMAYIHRLEDGPPGLGEWRDVPDSGGFTGRFVEPLRQALAGVPPAI